MSKTKIITITLTGAPPVRIDPAAWPVVAKAHWFSGSIEVQANYVRWIKARRHVDGRTIVYGCYYAGPGGAPVTFRGASGGFLVPADADTAQLVRAIRGVGDLIDMPELAEECIHELPPVDLE